MKDNTTKFIAGALVCSLAYHELDLYHVPGLDAGRDNPHVESSSGGTNPPGQSRRITSYATTTSASLPATSTRALGIAADWPRSA